MPIKLNGATSGSVELDVPAAVGSDLQLTLPATAGDVVVKAADGSVDLGSVDIDSSGRLLVGTSTSRGGWWNTAGIDSAVQVEATNQWCYSAVTNSANTLGPWINIGKSRGATVGSTTVVQDSDQLGGISFQGADGSELVPAAAIQAFVDNAPGTNDMPGRLVFSTTTDGASSPTERMRIDSLGNLLIGSPYVNAKLDIRMTGAATNNVIYAERTGVSTAGQGIYSYLVANTNLSGGSFSLYGQYVAATGSPGGGCLGVISSVYGILGYYDGAQSWAGYFNGSTYATGSYQGSDARLKDVIEPISGGILDKLANIQPVKYRWKQNTDQRESVGDSIQIGLIAQEVEEHFPELVKEITHTCPINPEQLEENQFDSSCSLNHDLGTFKTLEYQHLTAVLVEALKEAKTRIETLEASNADLAARLTALEGGES